MMNRDELIDKYFAETSDEEIQRRFDEYVKTHPINDDYENDDEFQESHQDK